MGNAAPTSALLGAALALAACACHKPNSGAAAESAPAPAPAPVSEEAPVAMPTPLQKKTAPDLVPGGALDPASELLDWILAHATDGQGKATKLLRLPVAIKFAPLGFASTVVGASLDAGDDALRLDLDDTSMGVGVAEHVRDTCDMSQPGCVIWLDGYWQQLLDLPEDDDLDDGPREHPFDVRGIGGLVEPGVSTVMIER